MSINNMNLNNQNVNNQNTLNKTKTASGIKKFIRLKGLISFVIVIALITAFVYLFAELLIKKAIEQGGGEILGAEVNVASVELKYSPLILTINDLQATNADQPEFNLFSFKQASVGVDLWQYLFGKTIIEQLNVEQLTLSSQRKTVGEVYLPHAEEAQITADKSIIPSLDLQLPDAKSLLKDTDLLTVKAAEQLQISYAQEQEKLLTLKEKLPNKAKLTIYQAKIKALGKMKVKSLDDINKIKTEFNAIKKSFKADQAIVKQAKKQLLASKELLARQLSILKNAPNKDWQKIEKKYQLDSVSTDDFAHILFGEQARGYYQTAESLYQRIAPLMSEKSSDQSEEEAIKNMMTKGRFVYFTENNPLPSFLIKQSKISMILKQGDFVIEGNELTHQHWLRNKPSEIHVKSTKLAKNGDVTFDSEFRLNKSGDIKGQGQWLIEQLALENITLLDKVGVLALKLEQGDLSGRGQFTFNQNEQTSLIHSKNHFGLTQSSFQGNAETSFAKVLLDTFKSLNKLTLDASINGAIQQPELFISSSINDALKGAVKKQISDKLAKFKGQINAGLNDKLTQSLKLNKQGSADLLDFEGLLTDTDKSLEQLKNSDVVKQQKKKLQDKAINKAKDKLKSKLGSFFG